MVNRIEVANIQIEAADKAASWILPKGTKWFTLQCRQALDVRIATVADRAAKPDGPYFTLKAAQSWSENVDVKTSLKLFFAAESSTIVEAIIGIDEEVL